jgi:hypothetical protein
MTRFNLNLRPRVSSWLSSLYFFSIVLVLLFLFFLPSFVHVLVSLMKFYCGGFLLQYLCKKNIFFENTTLEEFVSK